MSVFSDPIDFVDINKVTKKIKNQFDTKIALYHGGVHGALTDIGYIIENKIISPILFDGHDIVALGDIHKAQTFYIDKLQTLEEYNSFSKEPDFDQWEVIDDQLSPDKVHLRKKKSPIFRFPSSLIQQNHGEDLLNHGLSFWDIQTRTFSHVEIQNDYGYFTIEIDDGKLITDISTMPPKPKLRVKCKDSVATDIKRIVAEIRTSKNISDLVFMRVDGDDAKRQINSQIQTNLNKISDVEYQNKLLEDYLKNKYSEVMDDDTVNSVKAINKKINDLVVGGNASKGIRWKPVKFEFSNMFSYGEDNVVDFTKLSDVYGLFAANASGKSSLMDALCFTAFDKSSRAFKAVHVMNSQKNTFTGKFTFEINGTEYVIERKGTRDKKNNVKVDVNFYKIVNSEQISLNSEARRSTNEIIRDYLGDYEDFVLTSLALQGNQGSFIEMGQTERKELLSQFIGLNIFDSLHKVSNDQSRDLSGIIKAFNKEDTSKKILDIQSILEVLELKIADLSSQKEKFEVDMDRVKKSIDDEKLKIVNVDNVPTNVERLKTEKLDLESKLISAKSNVENIVRDLKLLAESKVAIEKELLIYNPEKLDADYKSYSSKSSLLNKQEIALNRLKDSVANKLAKIKHLESHSYDPNCKYCCDNVFVKDAMSAREGLIEDKKQVLELKTSIETLASEVSTLKSSTESRDKYLGIANKKTTAEGQYFKKDLEKANVLMLIEKATTRINELSAAIELYEKSKEVIEKNKIVRSAIEKLTTELYNLSQGKKAAESEYTSAYSKKVSFTDQVASLQKRIEEVEAAEEEYGAYQYYSDAVGKDGIPYRIISDAVPRIENEVNNILSQIVEFSMGIETDGKNVNVFIRYEDKKWPLELCSGMERFVSSLALRVALINISNLPRAPFLIVDEGFGALDADNIAMIHSLFDYLKTNFDFIIIISHLDAMRDMVNKHLEIKKENGFSKVDNSK
jgi:DNA repair exonuclease SbcCD ATPase subunit